MALMLMAAALAAGLGLLCGGHLAAARRLRLRAWPALIGAVALQVALWLVPSGLRGPVAAVACLLVAGWAVANRRRRSGLSGTALIAAGTAANAVAVAANGGMPVSRWALRSAGLPSSLDVARGHLDKHVTMSASTHLRLLGDVIPFPPLHMVLSAGDLLMLAGIAAAAWSALHPGRVPFLPLRNGRQPVAATT
jgi:hypothetical protein